jgi:hypothetical protein
MLFGLVSCLAYDKIEVRIQSNGLENGSIGSFSGRMDAEMYTDKNIIKAWILPTRQREG